jgi:predicted TIM-barrel fold metal-dependent hydrolase
MDEFYKKCEDNNIVLYLHFFMNHNIQFETPETIKQLVNGEEINMWEMAVFDLLSSDIFDKYPKLQVVMAEVIQRSIGKILRILRTAYTNNKDLFKCTQHPIQYIKNNIFLTIDIEQKESFNILIRAIGSNRLLFSTDYPHIDPSGMNKWKDTDDLYAAGLSQEDLENIAFRNAEKLFRL